MSGLRFDVQWEEAEEVASAELAATWARFSLYVGDECLTVVEDSIASSYRSTIDVSIYPLAEWFAFNWWFLTTPNAGRSAPQGTTFAPTQLRERHCLSAAADGFPWPPLYLLPEEGYYVASQSVLRSPLQRVNFVRSGKYILDLESTVYRVTRFLDSVIRRLEDRGVTGTRFQEEWSAIQSSDPDEAEFCRAAAVLGGNPYVIDAQLAAALMDAGERVARKDLFLEMLAAISPTHLISAVQWLNASLNTLERGDVEPRSNHGLWADARRAKLSEGTAVISPSRPWWAGYERARTVRRLLEVGGEARLDLDELVAVAWVDEPSPGLLEALVETDSSKAIAVTSNRRSQEGARFIQARTLSKAFFGPRSGLHLISHGTSVHDRAERAFAAELLAPAEGVATFLQEDFSEAARTRAARHFGVDQRVIDHQVENQVDWMTS